MNFTPARIPARSRCGWRNSYILVSLMANAKRNELEHWAYPKDVIEELSGARAPPEASQFEVLLPDAWLASHPE